MYKTVTALSLLALSATFSMTSAVANETANPETLHGHDVTHNRANNLVPDFPSADPSKPHTGAVLSLEGFNRRTDSKMVVPTDANKPHTGAVPTVQGFNDRS